MVVLVVVVVRVVVVPMMVLVVAPPHAPLAPPEPGFLEAQVAVLGELLLDQHVGEHRHERARLVVPSGLGVVHGGAEDRDQKDEEGAGGEAERHLCVVAPASHSIA